MNNEELDEKMAELMGWIYCDFDFRDYDGEYPMYIVLDALLLVFDEANKHREFSPSTDIAAAWQVVEKIDEHFMLERYIGAIGGVIEWVCTIDVGDIKTGIASTAPLAICRAALKAVEAE